MVFRLILNSWLTTLIFIPSCVWGFDRFFSQVVTIGFGHGGREQHRNLDYKISNFLILVCLIEDDLASLVATSDASANLADSCSREPLTLATLMQPTRSPVCERGIVDSG